MKSEKMGKQGFQRSQMTKKTHLQKKFVFALLVILLVVSGSLFIACASMSKNSALAASKGFVIVDNGSFYLNGNEFRFVATNNYYMHYSTDLMQSDVLDDAAEMGFNVLRIWGFQIGPNKDHNSYGLNTPARKGEPANYGIPEDKKITSLEINQFGYPKDIFERLDYTIAEAGKRGIKLVIALNNYWSDFGGLQQASSWQEWFNLENPTDFYTDAGCKYAYKDYVKTLITRVNTYTGIPYNEDPTIMTWELMNEPRNPQDPSGKILTAWAKEMSAYVNSLAPYQLCAVGDEGAFNRPDIEGFRGEGSHMYDGSEGVDFDALIALKNIDYGTLHLYPEAWGIEHEAIQGWGKQYLLQHIDSAKAQKKPVVLEEYGIGGAGLQNRLAVYDMWNKTFFEHGGNGTMVWILTSSNEYEMSEGLDGIYDDYDGFRILNDDSAVSNLLRGYAARVSGRTTAEAQALDAPRVYLLDPSRNQEAKSLYRVRSQIINNNKEIQSVKLFIDGKLAPAPNTMQYNVETDAYRININTESYEDGTELAIKAVFTFEDSTVMETEEHSIIVANHVTYTAIKTYDFSVDTADATSLGGYQAEIKKLSHTTLNGGMLEIACDFPGTNEWEELKVKFPTMSEVNQAAKISFTIYMLKDLAVASQDKGNEAQKLPGTQHYLAFDPGWVKTGIGENNSFLKDLDTVVLEDGKEYYKEVIEVEFFENTSYTLATICPTMGYVKYSGSMYMDDIVLFAKD